MERQSKNTSKSKQGTIINHSDWLGFKFVFYNVRTGAASPNIHDLISAEDLEFHPEGLINYLDFGYSVLGQTLLRNIRFTRPSGILYSTSGGLVEILDEDPARTILNGPESKETDVREQLQDAVSRWESSFSGDIVIPTSGGFDSRLLNILIRDKSRIRAYTYGISHRQDDSREVVHAKALSEKLGIAWESIKLEAIHSYFDQWEHLFGISTHAHGMYQVEFYTKICEKGPPGAALLSGIVGDLWAGSVNPAPIQSPRELHKLGYTHGLNADSSQCILKCRYELREKFFEENRRELQDARWRLLFLVRFKMILLRYLLKIPESMGFHPWSPFLEIGPSLGMLTLPSNRRENRRWQRDWFSEYGILLENLALKASSQNTLDSDAIRRQPPPSLDENALSSLFRRDYLRWINSQVAAPGLSTLIRSGMLRTPKIRWILRKCGLTDTQLKAYGAYLTLKPIDSLLRKFSRGYVG